MVDSRIFRRKYREDRDTLDATATAAADVTNRPALPRKEDEMIGDKLLHAKLHDVAEEVKSLEYRQIYLDALVKEARDTIAMFPNTLMLVALGTRLKEYDEHCAKATAHRSA